MESCFTVTPPVSCVLDSSALASAASRFFYFLPAATVPSANMYEFTWVFSYSFIGRSLPQEKPGRSWRRAPWHMHMQDLWWRFQLHLHKRWFLTQWLIKVLNANLFTCAGHPFLLCGVSAPAPSSSWFFGCSNLESISPWSRYPDNHKSYGNKAPLLSLPHHAGCSLFLSSSTLYLFDVDG